MPIQLRPPKWSQLLKTLGTGLFTSSLFYEAGTCSVRKRNRFELFPVSEDSRVRVVARHAFSREIRANSLGSYPHRFNSFGPEWRA